MGGPTVEQLTSHDSGVQHELNTCVGGHSKQDINEMSVSKTTVHDYVHVHLRYMYLPMFIGTHAARTGSQSLPTGHKMAAQGLNISEQQN